MSEVFLSTPSARRATLRSSSRRPKLPISIHALREEGDSTSSASGTSRNDFYPRPPRGGRPPLAVYSAAKYDISIHALREEGDVGAGQGEHPARISIHALREEGDRLVWSTSKNDRVFLSTPSARRATKIILDTLTIAKFLSTPSARRATRGHSQQ